MISPFNAPDAPQAIGPYSHGVACAGRMIFCSGQVALLSDGSFLDGTVKEQTEHVFINIQAVLAAQGATLKNIVKTTVFLSDMKHFAEMNEVYAISFGDHRPARSTVAVAGLPKNALVEIEVIACVD